MSLMLFVAIAGVFTMVGVLAGSATSWWLSRTVPELKRLRNLTPAPATGVLIVQRTLAEHPHPTLTRVSRFVPKSGKDMARLRQRLASAGYPKFEHAVSYSLAQVAMPLVCGGTTVALLGWDAGWLTAFLLAAGGYLLPSVYINRKTAFRQKAIQNGLPDALDLLTVCVEAGNGLDHAIAKASDELQIAHPVLAEELKTITMETRAGKRRIEALKNFAQRTGVEDARMLIAMLIQTDRFGTSIGQALRSHAETSRTKRRQRAEERAARVSVKLVFPLALCLFPALYVVCFGPVVVQIYRSLLGGGL